MTILEEANAALHQLPAGPAKDAVRRALQLFSGQRTPGAALMVDPNMLPDDVLGDVLENLGWDPDVREDRLKFVGEVALMGWRETFERYLNWNGIVGYTDGIVNALDGARSASRIVE